MLNRCYNFEDKKDFPLYGGRGISVCDRWHTFENFLQDMGERPAGTTLNRKDPNGHYTPDNCCWSDLRQQALDRRSTVWVELEGKRMCLKDWAKVLGVSYRGTLHARSRVVGAEKAVQYYLDRKKGHTS